MQVYEGDGVDQRVLFNNRLWDAVKDAMDPFRDRPLLRAVLAFAAGGSRTRSQVDRAIEVLTKEDALDEVRYGSGPRPFDVPARRTALELLRAWAP